MDNNFLLYDRIEKIKSVIEQYGEENFYISFSGGKDSVVMSKLVDIAIPNNKIPRVFCNTGIEYNMIVDYVNELKEVDDRIEIIKPTNNIKRTLEMYGYPFKSKAHSKMVWLYYNSGYSKTIDKYINNGYEGWNKRCPKKLIYQFEDGTDFDISDKCCDKLKKEPLEKWQAENNRPYSIVGIMREEGGRRDGAVCLAFSRGKLKAFHPLAPLTKEWEEWFIKEYNIKLCGIYYEPYNLTRTGCKGCPFAINLQDNLDMLEKFFPAERKQCEYIWKPVYDEYRRLKYRLKE